MCASNRIEMVWPWQLELEQWKLKIAVWSVTELPCSHHLYYIIMYGCWLYTNIHIHIHNARNTSCHWPFSNIWLTKIYFDLPNFPYIFNGTAV